jgi:hypothetical protein
MSTPTGTSLSLPPSTMAEQHVAASEIHAGGSVTINPTQIINGVTGAAARGWTEALLRGALEHAGLAANADEANRLEDDGRPAEAAAIFEQIAVELGTRDYSPASQRYYSRAARLYRESDNRERARALELRLCIAALGDGTPGATNHARAAAELSAPDERWEPEALLVIASWPERHPNELTVLDLARERSIDQPTELRWAARIVDHLRRAGESSRAKALAQNAIGDRPLGVGARLDLELDLLDLLDDDTAQDRRSADLQAWLADPTLPIAEVARAWQRRGVALARRADAEGARVAFLQAVATWSRDPGYDDQVAAAYFSALTARAALGDRSAWFDEGRELASGLRGSKDTAHSRFERLMRRGLAALVAGEQKLSDAWWAFAAAVDESRRAGNLSDLFRASELLGDCLTAAGRPGEALAAYLVAGECPKARSVTEAFTADQVLQTVPLDGPRWERAAAWAAIAGTGTNASDAAADQLAAAALQQESVESANGGPPNAAWYALEVLANVACAIQDDALLQRALPLLRDRMTFLMGHPHRVADPLLRLTLSGRLDTTPALVDAFLDSDVHAQISADMIATLVNDHPTERARLVNAAVAGNGEALDALAFTERGLSESDALCAAAHERVRAVIESEALTIEEADGTTTLTQGIAGSLAPEGIYARVCDADLREVLVDALLALLADTRVMLMTRVGAVHAIHNLGSALPASRADAVARALRPLALNPDVVADFDQVDHDEPLARFKINLAPTDALRESAIEALGRLGEEHTTIVNTAAETIEPALMSQSEPLLCAALVTMARHPTVIPPSLNVASLLMAPWESVRLKALGVLEAVDPTVALAVAHQLLTDRSNYVRRNLLGVAERAGPEGKQLLEALSEDIDCYIRATARHRLLT